MEHSCNMMLKHQMPSKNGFVKNYYEHEMKRNIYYCHYCGEEFSITKEMAERYKFKEEGEK